MNINQLRERLAKWVYPGEIPNLEVLKRATQLAIEAGKRRSCKIVVWHKHPDCYACAKGELREEQDATQLS